MFVNSVNFLNEPYNIFHMSVMALIVLIFLSKKFHPHTGVHLAQYSMVEQQ